MNTAVLLPGTPLLIPGVGGRQDPASGLREIAVSAVRQALRGDPQTVEVVVADRVSDRMADSPFDLHRLLGRLRADHDHPAESSGDGPLSVAVGRSVLTGAGWDGPVQVRSAAWPKDAATTDSAETDAAAKDAAGDGCGCDGRPVDHDRRRIGVATDRGPGVPRPEALEFDDSLVSVISRGDARGLIELCQRWRAQADELMITGLPTWSELARMADRPVRASVQTSADPFGMLALVATWSW